MDPAGKVAVVTGGNSGLGEAAALRLAAAGAKVVTLDRGGAAPGGAGDDRMRRQRSRNRSPTRSRK